MLSKDSKFILVTLFLGLMLGISLDLLLRYQTTFHVIDVMLPVFFILFALSYNGSNALKLSITSLITALVLSTPFLAITTSQTFFGANLSRVSSDYYISFFVSFPFLLYVAHSFHYAYHRDGNIKMSYRSLFLAVWNTLPILFIALIFSSIANGLLFLTAAIFNSVGFYGFWHLLTHNIHFQLISNCVLFFVGIGIAKQSESIIDSMRFILLRIIYYLFPFLALITIVYFILYLIYGQRGGPFLIYFIVLGLLFFNACFQDGTSQKSYHKFIRLGIKVYRIVLSIMAFIFAYLVLIKTPYQYFPINAAIYLSMTVFYCLSYAIAALLPSHHDDNTIKMANVCIALFFAICILIANNPIKPFGGYNLFKQSASTAASQKLQSSQIKKYPQGPQGVIFPTGNFFIVTPSPIKEITPNQNQQLAFDRQFKKQNNILAVGGLTWVTINPKNESAKQSNNPICRASFNQGYEIGVIKGKVCIITYGGNVLTHISFDQLIGGENTTTWVKRQQGLLLGLEYRSNMMQDYFGNKKAIVFDRMLRSLSACRVSIENKIYYGKTVDNRCNIAYDKQERSYQSYEVLAYTPTHQRKITPQLIDINLNTSGFSWTNNASDSLFIAGINTSGNLGICRVAYKDGLQIGAFIDQQCIITYGGVAINVQDFELLSAENTPHYSWDNPIGFNYYEKKPFLALGYEILERQGGIRKLYACRTIVDNQIKLGKVVANNCNIAMGGKEITIPINQAFILSVKNH
jgi:DM9 repeat